jgi:hypothetical protein
MTTMKKNITRWIIAAAAVAAVAGTAAAESWKAEIPLAFRAGGKLMQPGEYKVYSHGRSGAAVFTIYNLETKASEGLAAARNGRVNKAWQPGVPVLVFECAGGACMLREIWNGIDDFAFLFPRPRGRSAEGRIAVVPLTVVKGD